MLGTEATLLSTRGIFGLPNDDHYVEVTMDKNSYKMFSLAVRASTAL